MANKKNPPKAKPPTENDDDQPDDGDEGGDGGEGDQPDPEEENRRINAIVTSRVKREMKAVNTQLEELKGMVATLAKAKADEPADDDEGDDGDKPAAPAVDPKLSKKMSRLERELADEKAARQKAEKERQDAEEKRSKDDARSQFQAALIEHGITSPKLQRAALNELEESGLIVRDENGKVRFKGVDRYGTDILQDPKTGLREWVQKEGKEYMPAIETGGSGSGGSRANGPSANMTRGEYGKLTPQQKAAIELERASQGLPPLGE